MARTDRSSQADAIDVALGFVPKASQLSIAYSGGLDSTALLHAVAARRSTKQLRAIHINHRLQPDADRWERHCCEFAQRLGIAVVVVRAAVAVGNVEAQARRARYQAWREMLRPDECLLLAHHADDQVETVLWQLVTGRAAVGMPCERPLGHGRLMRPLLGLRRAVLERYVEVEKLDHVHDPTNADLSFDRNFIRHEVLPKIDARFPDAIEMISKNAGGAVKLQTHEPLAIQGIDAKTVRSWLGMAVSERLIEEVLRQAVARNDSTPTIMLPDARSIRRYDGDLYMVENANVEEDLGDVQVARSMSWPHGVLAWRLSDRGLLASGPLSVRFRTGTERITPIGRGRSKSLKALFQEMRIPPWQRTTWPLLFDGDQLIAVPGIAVAEDKAVDGGWWPTWEPL